MDYNKIVLNWERQPKDARDRTARRFFRSPYRAAIANTLNLRQQCSPVRNQGERGKCTGMAVFVGACEFLAMRGNRGVLPFQQSPDFGYYNGRRAMGGIYTKMDSGCFVRTVIKAGVRNGVCSVALCPEDIEVWRKPSVEAYAEAQRFQITEYASLEGGTWVETDQNLAESVARGYPFCFGFDVYESFMTDWWKKSYVAPIPNLKTERLLGGHAVFGVGHDRMARFRDVKNSWGAEWGDGGYFGLPDWFIETGHASDFMVVRGQENGTDGVNWFTGTKNWLYGHKEKAAA